MSHKAIYPRCLVLTKNRHNSSSRHCGDSGSSSSAVVAAVATMTPVETALAGGKTTINNQLKAAAATATETEMLKATATTMKMKGDGGDGSEGQ